MSKTPCVCVTFDGSHDWYTYFTHLPLERGDLVVVETIRGFKLATVAHDNPSKTHRKRATKWIVDKVDLDVHRARSALIKSMKGDT